MLTGLPKEADLLLPSWCPELRVTDWRARERGTLEERLWLSVGTHYPEWTIGGDIPHFVESKRIEALHLKGKVVDEIQKAWPFDL